MQNNIFLNFKRYFPFVVCWVVSALIANYTPDGFGSGDGLVNYWMNFFYSNFVSVRGYVDRSSFPSAALMEFSFYYSLGPYIVTYLVMNYQFFFPKIDMLDEKIMHVHKRVLFFLYSVTIFPGMAVFMLFFNYGIEFKFIEIAKSKMALGVYGPLYGLSGFVLIAMSIILFKKTTGIGN